MATTTPAPRLTSLSHGAGCACKLSLEELRSILSRTTAREHPDLLVGLDTGDDAAVWRRSGGRALVATTDFFTPLVDDARTWGRIAAANAVSDIYAMGGTPLFALNIVGWPRDLPFEVLGEVLDGAAEIAEQAGYIIAGGHSIDSVEPLYGQAVVGEIDSQQVLTNAGGRAGDALLLTKPIGTGIITTAVKRSPLEAVEGDKALATAYADAIASMTRLNDDAARTARSIGASAATDVTGFGLLGHLHRLALASGLAAQVQADAVPLLSHVVALRDAGHVPGGSRRNADQAGSYLGSDLDEPMRLLLADAQTSGGLLIACDPDVAGEAQSRLQASGHRTAVIGRLLGGAAGMVDVV